jgi:hypothetical protein
VEHYVTHPDAILRVQQDVILLVTAIFAAAAFVSSLLYAWFFCVECFAPQRRRRSHAGILRRPPTSFPVSTAVWLSRGQHAPR